MTGKGSVAMKIREVETIDEVLEQLIAFSRDWEAEQSCAGYRANERSDIEGNRVFVAEEDGKIVGYLFGKLEEAKKMSSIMPEGTPYFEVEELYVVPEKRSQGMGKALFEHAENVLSTETKFFVLSTATKNWKAIFHFYLDEVGMDFWSARLYKKIR